MIFLVVKDERRLRQRQLLCNLAERLCRFLVPLIALSIHDLLRLCE